MAIIRYELVEEDDREQVERLTENTFPWGDYIANVFDEWIKEGIFIKAIDSYGKILGILHVRIFKGFAWLEGIRVKQELRRKGIGIGLTRKGIEMSGMKVFRLMTNERNVPSIQLAKSLGFKEIDDIYYVHQGLEAEAREIAEEFGFKERSEIPKIRGYVDRWVWFPIEDYKGKVYSNGEIVMLDTKPVFFAQGFLEGYKQYTKHFDSDHERFVVFELKIDDKAYQTNYGLQQH
ncbi:MAG: GNAT family N-acetyltransferase [Caldisphaeraceae archaeon]|nr:GNAT family N-acetyltransferase [Caldisphaeraceae archaeon]